MCKQIRFPSVTLRLTSVQYEIIVDKLYMCAEERLCLLYFDCLVYPALLNKLANK